MKLKDGFITHESDGEQIMVSAGNTGFNGLVRSNRTAAVIIDLLKKETTEEDIAEAMLAKYDVARKIVERDVQRIIAQLRSIGALDE